VVAVDVDEVVVDGAGVEVRVEPLVLVGLEVRVVRAGT
jgi:hypothetical protein